MFLFESALKTPQDVYDEVESTTRANLEQMLRVDGTKVARAAWKAHATRHGTEAGRGFADNVGVTVTEEKPTTGNSAGPRGPGPPTEASGAGGGGLGHVRAVLEAVRTRSAHTCQVSRGSTTLTTFIDKQVHTGKASRRSRTHAATPDDRCANAYAAQPLPLARVWAPRACPSGGTRSLPRGSPPVSETPGHSARPATRPARPRLCLRRVPADLRQRRQRPD